MCKGICSDCGEMPCRDANFAMEEVDRNEPEYMVFSRDEVEGVLGFDDIP